MDSSKVDSDNLKGESFDDKDFRHLIAADPQTKDSNVVEAAENDADLQAYWQELKALDDAMKDASEVPVPSDLEAKLFALAEQDIESNKDVAQTNDAQQANNAPNVVPFTTPKRNNFLQLAMVASIAFAIGLSFTFFNQQPNLQSGTDIAMAHLYHEQEYTNNRDHVVALDDVNVKLASFGGTMAPTPAKVTFANFCFFENQKSLHLVMDTDEGQVTMFITPVDLEADIDSRFGDETYTGRSWKVQEVDVTVIGEKSRISDSKMEYLKNSMQFST